MKLVNAYKPVYDLLLLDIEMPLLDGMSAARRIRKLDQNVFIIFITNMAKYAINGYEVMFVHVNPSLWGYRDVQNYVLSLEAEGYEVHVLMLDYLNMLDKRGLDNNGPTGSNIRDLFRRMRNFCAP